MRPRPSVLTLLAFVTVSAPVFSADKRAPFSVVEAGIPEIQKALAEGRVTSRELVRQYLTRIALYEDRLNAVMAVSPDALISIALNTPNMSLFSAF